MSPAADAADEERAAADQLVVREAQVRQWAQDPSAWGAPKGVLSGPEAIAYGRSVLSAAGVDVAGMIERRAGRPRLGDQPVGAAEDRSPRINVAISPAINARLLDIAAARGLSRSEIVRAALADYLDRARAS
ncbi:MAG: ribbon-helix-helix protein, CopG family [Frankiaceae bacterium]|jgi:hypothetical protein|nr:ribbon-helix-helix protein, CopG family [Frankiaceae bacterium]